MTSITAIQSLPSGARFHRADLHIHSFGGSHDVKDVTMTPDAIVRTAIAEKLDIIAVTDHNEIRNIEDTLKAAAKSSVVVPRSRAFDGGRASTLLCTYARCTSEVLRADYSGGSA